MAGAACDLQHPSAVLQLAAGTVDDHIELPTLQRGQSLARAAVSAEVFNSFGDGIAPPGEQGEGMALGLKPGHQGLADETGPSHHQNLHGCPQKKRCH